MRNLIRVVVTLFAVSTLGAVMARADTLTYDFLATGTPWGDISFSLPASPTPTSFTSNSFSVLAEDISVGGSVIGSEMLDFFTLGEEGGGGGDGIHAEGPQLFSGSTANPTFLTGDFTVGDNFNLSITRPGGGGGGIPSSVPEPASLFLFGTGVLGLYGLARKKLRFMREVE